MKPKFFLILFLSLACGLPAQHYPFKNYSVQQGLPHSQVSQIVQDRNGFIWLSMYGGGLARFDGKTFTEFSEAQGLSNLIARPLLIDSKNRVWVGTLGGGAYVMSDGKRFEKFSFKDVTMNEKVYAIAEEKNGSIWFGCDNGAYVYNGKTLRHLTGKDGVPEKPIMNILCDSKNNVWLSPWENGIVILRNSAITRFDTTNGLPHHTVMKFWEEDDGTVWVGTFGGVGIFSYKNSSAKPVFRELHHPLLKDMLIYNFTKDRRGKIWIGTSGNGALRYDKATGQSESFSVKSGLPGNIILDVMCDTEGDIWMSTWGYGACVLESARLSYYQKENGLASNVVNGVALCNDTVVAATGNGLQFLSKKENAFRADQPSAGRNVLYTFTDSKKRIWHYTPDGLFYLEGTRLVKIDGAPALNVNPITHITEDKHGRIWLADWGLGALYFENGALHNAKELGIPLAAYVNSIYCEGDNIWFCSWDGGLVRYNGKESKTWKNEKGMSTNHIFCAVKDAKGTLWLGTLGGGLLAFNGKIFRSISSLYNVGIKSVNAMALDERNGLYLGTSNGLFYYNEAAGTTRYYGFEEGFTSYDCLRNAIAYDRMDKLLWVGTKQGLCRFDVKEDLDNTTPPRIFISDLKLFYEPVKYGEGRKNELGVPLGFSFPYDQNHLTIKFHALAFSNPTKVNYRFKMEGLDNAWSPFTEKDEAVFSALPPGDYVFKAEARNSNGVVSAVPAGISISILPPFWKTKWFYGLSVLVIGGSTVLVFRWRTRRLRKEKELLEDKVHERTYELEKAYKEIEEKNHEITDSIQYARRIQQAQLASSTLLEKYLPEHFVLFKPKDIVSGDFYWASHTPQGFMMITADCTGHGVPGAFMSLLSISKLNETVNEKKIVSPEQVLNTMRSEIIKALNPEGSPQEGKDGMDCVLCLFDFKAMTLKAACANNPIWVLRDGAITEIKADKMPVGMHRGAEGEFRLIEFNLQKEDVVLTFTDGFADQFGGPRGKKFKYKQIKELLLANSSKPMEELKTALDHAITQWKGDLEQVDDICIIGVKL